MKTIAIIITALFASLIAGCDKGDIEIKTMTRGSGVWNIESMKYDTFDAAGVNVIGSKGYAEVGELVFFESPTTNALFDHHLVVANIWDTSGWIYSDPGDVFYDGDRVHFQEDPDENHNFPDFLEGTWTIDTDKKREQVWSIYQSNAQGGLYVKCTMTLKYKK